MKATNKTKTITLVSHYNKQTLRLRLTNKQVDKLMTALRYYDLWQVISNDNDLIYAGYEPVVFSRSQMRRISGLSGIDCYDKVEGLN